MNIFYLDTDIETCARYHVDKHVVKMPIEYLQMISDTLAHYGYDHPYKVGKAHHNHPCTKWVRRHNGNYTYLWDLADAVGNEYTRRYGKLHKSTKLLRETPRVIDIGVPYVERSPLHNCTTIKEDYPHLGLVDIYRLFYLRDKAHILNWKNTEEPFFVGDRFYRQQLKAIGTCPGDKKDVKPKKITKSDIIDNNNYPADLEKLTLKDLQLLQLNAAKLENVSIPEGRLKKPYLEVMASVNKEVSWDKLTIANLVSAIKYFQKSD